MGKRNILEEAISESKTLREAALSNAKVALMENIKDVLKETVEKQLNEDADMEHAEPDGDECAPDDSGNMTEGMGEVDDDLDMDLDEEGGDEGEEDMTDLDAGLGGDELAEAIAEALDTINEVENPSMGDADMVDHAHPSHGFNGDKDSKEEDWEVVEPPHAKNQYQAQGVKSESVKSLRKKLAEQIKENILLKKANKKLRETVEDIRLFNTKITLANKLITKEGLSADTKRKIVAKMDTAKTVVEAKSIFEAFDCALGTLSESAPVKKKAPALTEVLGSAGANVPMNKESLKDTVYGKSYTKERFQVLAGIKSDE